MRMRIRASWNPPEGSPEVDVCPDLLFVNVAGGKVSKNRLHLDLRPVDQAAEVARLLDLGARRTSIGQTGDERWGSFLIRKETSSAFFHRLKMMKMWSRRLSSRQRVTVVRHEALFLGWHLEFATARRSRPL